MVSKRFLLANDMKWIGYHVEDDYAEYSKGKTLKVKADIGDDHIHVDDFSGWKVGDVISIGNSNPNRVIKSFGTSDEVYIYPDISENELVGSAVLLHYNLIQGHVQNVAITNDMNKTNLRVLQKGDALPSNISSYGAWSGEIVIKYKIGSDIVSHTEAGVYNSYSSIIGMSLGKERSPKYFSKIHNDEELTSFSILLKAVPTPDNEYAESLFIGCVVDSMSIESTGNEATATLTVKYQREITPPSDFNVLGSHYKTGGSSLMPSVWRGKYFLSQGNTKVEIYPIVRATRITEYRIYANNTSYFNKDDEVVLYTGEEDSLVEEELVVANVTSEYVEVTTSIPEGFEPFSSFLRGVPSSVISECTLEINNRVEKIPDLNLDGSYCRKHAGTSQTVTVRLKTVKHNSLLYRIKSDDPYHVLMDASVEYKNIHSDLVIRALSCHVTNNPNVEYDSEPKIKDEDIELSASDCDFTISE